MVDRLEADQPTPRNTKATKEYEQFLLSTLGVGSLLLSVLICVAVSLPLELAEQLALTPEEVTDLAGPGSRLLAKSNISSKVRSTLVNSSDYVALGTAVTGYVVRILSEIKGRSEHVNFEQATPVPPAHASSGLGPVAPSSNGSYRSSSAAASLANFGAFAI